MSLSLKEFLICFVGLVALAGIFINHCKNRRQIWKIIDQKDGKTDTQ